MDPGLRLRQDFAGRRRVAMRGAALSQVKRSLIGALGGAVAAAVTLAVMTTSMGFETAFSAFLLEIGLTAFMGLVLARVNGGLLKGAFLLPLAYGAAYLLRRTGFDPGHWFAESSALVDMPGLCHLIAICGLLALGGLLGYVVESRSA